MAAALWNWAGSHAFHAARVHDLESVEDVRHLVARSDKLKVVGTRHSFNDIADTAGDLISLQRLDRVVTTDIYSPRPRVTVEAGVTYGQLCRHLDGTGYALHNLASLPHISVAGAVATATHGSGDGNGNLATAVHAIELVTADGEVQAFSRDNDGDRFPGMVVALGGLGVMTKVTLNLVPTFDVRQEVYENLPFADWCDHFEKIVSGAYSVSSFTDWRDERINQVWVKRRIGDPVRSDASPEAYGATPATRDVHPIGELSAEACTLQMGVAGPWHARLPHFRIDHTPSSGEELQSEFFVPRRHAVAALRAIAGLRDRVAPLLQISEIRTIGADDLWMSPCCGQPCVGIHFTWKKDWPAVREVLPAIEAQLAPFDARPHWGKLFTMLPGQVQARYAKLADFRRLLQSFDPGGKFRNAYLDRYVFSAP